VVPEGELARADHLALAEREDAVVGVRAAASMDRALVRDSVERRFDSNRMVDDYLEVYHRVVALDHARRADNDA